LYQFTWFLQFLSFWECFGLVSLHGFCNSSASGSALVWFRDWKLGFGLAKDVFGLGEFHEFANIVRTKEECWDILSRFI
jgi:hypothetical protein